MTGIVLDASALLAMLNDEPGGDKVADVIGRTCISAVNFAEVVSHFIYLGMPEDAADAMLRPLPVVIEPVDRDLAIIAGNLRASTAMAGLSLGDRFCLALAIRDKLPAWTADRQWKQVADRIGAAVIIIR